MPFNQNGHTSQGEALRIATGGIDIQNLCACDFLLFFFTLFSGFVHFKSYIFKIFKPHQPYCRCWLEVGSGN